MIKNIVIAVLILMAITISIFAFQKAIYADAADKKARQLAVELNEANKRAERSVAKAEEQAAKAIEAMAEAARQIEELKKCKEGK